MKLDYTPDELAILEIAKYASVDGYWLNSAVKRKYSSVQEFRDEWAESFVSGKSSQFYLKCMDLVLDEIGKNEDQETLK